MASSLLLSEEYRHILDVIDKLRAAGVGRYVDLPQIVVCGDQSAGKSSVLEAISGASFPTKDNLCTRFATEPILRRSDVDGGTVSIIPGPKRNLEEMERLKKFHVTLEPSKLNLGDIVEKAKVYMGLNDKKVFSKNVLRVELQGPEQPNVTLVDLPGVFRAGNRDQSMSDAGLVTRMVEDVISRERSIILSVISAKSDIQLQDLIELAREVDPNGSRTMGLITKPDTLDPFSDSEQAYVKLFNNDDVQYGLGWHVLKNRSFDMRKATSEERDAAEEVFFSKGVWAGQDRRWLGVKHLKSRLMDVIQQHVVTQLPGLLRGIDKGLKKCTERLDRLGQPRATVEQQRRYLLDMSHHFTNLIKMAVEGNYSSHTFFAEQDHSNRLRAAVSTLQHEFAEEMNTDGQARVIVDKADGHDIPQDKFCGPQVTEKMRRSRGRELPGLFDPLIVGELFVEQCQLWKGLTERLMDDVTEAVDGTIQNIVRDISGEDIAEKIYGYVTDQVAEPREKMLVAVHKLINEQVESHPITFNPDLTKHVQDAQASQHRARIEEALKECSPEMNLRTKSEVSIVPATFLAHLEQRTEINMEQYGSETAVDYMQAYYNVAMKDFIDNVSRLGIEAELLHELPKLLTHSKVFDLAEEEVTQLAAESHETASERTELTEKRNTLEWGLSELKQASNSKLKRRQDKLTGLEKPGKPFKRRVFVFKGKKN